MSIFDGLYKRGTLIRLSLKQLRLSGKRPKYRSLICPAVARPFLQTTAPALFESTLPVSSGVDIPWASRATCCVGQPLHLLGFELHRIAVQFQTAHCRLA